jgi:hypothetical protein
LPVSSRSRPSRTTSSRPTSTASPTPTSSGARRSPSTPARGHTSSPGCTPSSRTRSTTPTGRPSTPAATRARRRRPAARTSTRPRLRCSASRSSRPTPDDAMIFPRFPKQESQLRLGEQRARRGGTPVELGVAAGSGCSGAGPFVSATVERLEPRSTQSSPPCAKRPSRAQAATGARSSCLASRAREEGCCRRR